MLCVNLHTYSVVLVCFTGPSALTVNITKNIETLSIVVQWDAVDDSLPTTYVTIWTWYHEREHKFLSAAVIEQTSYTITGLTLDTVYTLTVTATNKCGTGPEFITSISFSADTTSSTSSISLTVTASTNPMTIMSSASSVTITTSTSIVTTTAAMIYPSATTNKLITTTVNRNITTTTTTALIYPSVTTNKLITTTVSRNITTTTNTFSITSLGVTVTTTTLMESSIIITTTTTAVTNTICT